MSVILYLILTLIHFLSFQPKLFLFRNRLSVQFQIGFQISVLMMTSFISPYVCLPNWKSFICVAWCLRLPKTPVTFLLWRQLWQHSDICPWCSQAIPTMTRKGKVIIGPTRHDWTFRGKVVIFGGNSSLVVIVCSRAFCAFFHFLTLLTIRQFRRMKIGMIIFKGRFCKPKTLAIFANGPGPDLY